MRPFPEQSTAILEKTFPGLTSLSSGFSSVRAQDGLCNRHDLYLSNLDGCVEFSHRSATSIERRKSLIILWFMHKTPCKTRSEQKCIPNFLNVRSGPRNVCNLGWREWRSNSRQYWSIELIGDLVVHGHKDLSRLNGCREKHNALNTRARREMNVNG